VKPKAAMQGTRGAVLVEADPDGEAIDRLARELAVAV
jgi:hypothetical protein